MPAAGSDADPWSWREPLRRAEAPLREADPDQRPGLARSRTVHPVRPLHPLRRRGGRRQADPLRESRQRHPGDDVPRRAVRVVLLRQHRADLSGRRAHGDALPVQGPTVGPRAGREHLHHVFGRMPGRDPVEPKRVAAVSRRRLRRGQLGLAVRPRPVRLRGGQLRPASRRPARARRVWPHGDVVERRARGRGRARARGPRRRWASGDRSARRCSRHERGCVCAGPSSPTHSV